ncbi:MAG: BlaI/MecI/CopY family transcriptional regulator [Pseudomonadota bacterium]
MSLIPPSSSELRLLQALWRDGRMSAREIHEATVAVSGWSYSATRKTLDRMAEKGLVVTEPVHGIKTFVPGQPKVETLAGLITNFARNVLDTEAPLPAAMFSGSSLIDGDEIEELEEMLQRLDEENEA